MVNKAMADINSGEGRSQYVNNNRPALDEQPNAPDSYYETLNMDAVDKYLNKNYDNTDDRYYLRNQIKKQFQQAKDSYPIQKAANLELEKIPAVKNEIDAYNKKFPMHPLNPGDLMNSPQGKYILMEAGQQDPDIQEKYKKIYGEAAAGNEEAKNNFLRAQMDNSAFGVTLRDEIPFHDQITGASKAVQGFFKYSGQVGQLASDLIDIIPAKGAREAAYSTRPTGENLIEENKFPENGGLG